VVTIVHGSDLHFGKPHDAGAARDFLEFIRASAPDLLVLSGDFTQRAKVSEYEAARRWMDALPEGLPCVVTAGNHDVPLYRVWERIFAPFRNYHRWISPELDSTLRIPGVSVVSLNSAAPRRAVTNGRIDRRQLEWARKTFAAAPAGDARIVVVHHHLAPAPDYEEDVPLPGAPRILAALEGMGVDLVLSGHLHRAYIGNSLDVFDDPKSPREKGVVIVQSGTTSSRRGRARERARQSCNLIRLHADRVEVVHCLRRPEAGGFAPSSAHVFPRGPDRWFRGDPLSGGGGG